MALGIRDVVHFDFMDPPTKEASMGGGNPFLFLNIRIYISFKFTSRN